MSSAHSISILILEKRRFMLTQIQKNIEGKYLVTRIVGSKKENNQIFAKISSREKSTLTDCCYHKVLLPLLFE